MKRASMVVFLFSFFIGIAWAAYQIAAPVDQPLAKYMPPGSLLSLEAKDFSSLLRDWNSSQQKKQWLESSNYEVFSRSRLFLRLKGASDQFAAAAGLPPDMNFLEQVAGEHSMMAIYDIGNLQFLCITYLPSAKSMQTQLWQTRAKFEPRNAGGVNFYVRRDPESQKEVVFAFAGDYLLLGTREDLVAAALQLMAGSKGRTIEDEPWWSQAVAASGAMGELRMILNLDKIVSSPYFRTYWVQQNITDLKQYSAAVADLFRSGNQYREERVLVKRASANAPSSVADTEATADLIRFVPDTAGMYEAKAKPSADTCFDLLTAKLLAPHPGAVPASQIAPAAPSSSGDAGADSDLETRIDQPFVQTLAAEQTTSALKDLLNNTAVLASLQVHSTQLDEAGVFIKIHSAIVFRAESDWDETAIRYALAEFIRPNLTAGQLGIGWQQKSGYQQLDGLWPLSIAVHGKDLLIADNSALIEAMLSHTAHKADYKPAVFIAGFNHEQERKNYLRLARVIDRPNISQSSGSGDRQPQFFSQNLASLSTTLAEVIKESVVVREENGKVLQTVIYEWAQQ